MADLTPKTIGELPSASSLSDSDLIPLSSGGSSKKTLWSVIKSYFVSKAYRNNSVSISEDSNSSTFLTIWQTSSASNTTKGLIVRDNTIGAWDDDNQTWLWRAPLFPSESLSAWPVTMGGTGATTASGAWSNLGVISGSNYCKFPDGTLICWGEKTFTISSSSAQQHSGSKYWYIEAKEDIAFPVAFVNSPSLTVTKTTGGISTVGFVDYGNAKILEVDFVYPDQPTFGSITTKVSWQAIGRWQA